MRRIVTLLIVLAAVGLLAGCGEQAVPGGRNEVHVTRPDGTKVSFFGNKDTALDKLAADLNAGTLNIEKLNTNGSTLGNMQMQWSIVESNNRRDVILGMESLFGQALSAYGLRVVPGSTAATGQPLVVPTSTPQPTTAPTPR